MQENVDPSQVFTAQQNADERWIFDNHTTLYTEHPYKWIAVLAQKVIAVADNLPALEAMIHGLPKTGRPVLFLLINPDAVY